MSWGGRDLLCTTVDCAGGLLWTPPALESLYDGVEIGYWADGYMRYEMLETDEEVHELASRAEYDTQDEAHIAITHELSIGTNIVWLKVERDRLYSTLSGVDVRFHVGFANPEECTRFLHEDMTKLEHLYIRDYHSDVINDIIDALSPLDDDHDCASRNAARRGIPFSQFGDEYPQPETQVIRRRGSNRGDDRPCFLTLHLSTQSCSSIIGVDWSATTIPPTFPSPSGTFQSLNNLHLKFPSHTLHDRDHDSTSRSRHEDLTITISAREISFSTGTDSVSLGNGFTVSSSHRTVTVNYINAIIGDAFLGPISGGNNGGRNNVHNSFSLRTDEAANTWQAVPSEPTPERKGISTLVRRFARSMGFGPPRAADNKLYRSRSILSPRFYTVQQNC